MEDDAFFLKHGLSPQYDWDCPAGWRKTVAKAIHAILEAGVKPEDFGQIKSKLGGLCIYMDVNSPETQKLIDLAEQACDAQCEECGKPARLTIFNGWQETLCEKHRRGDYVVENGG